MDYNTYKDYDENSYFSNFEIQLKLIPGNQDNKGYQMTGVSFSGFDSFQDRNMTVKNICEQIQSNFKPVHLDRPVLENTSRSSWSVFYTMKELLDGVKNGVTVSNKNPASTKYALYYRGQNASWPTKPGILRSKFNDSYRDNFKNIIRELSYRFPDKMAPDMGRDFDELNQFAMLQHYGLGTPLVDITANPYKAMLFMSHNYTGSGVEEDQQLSPVLDVFFIPEEIKNVRSGIFAEVAKNASNPRIDAQEGAFLNFNSWFAQTPKKKICKIRMKICIDEDVLGDLDNNQLYQEDEGSTHRDKLITLYSDACDDITQKLSSFCYDYNDLFPDFEQTLQHLAESYRERTVVS
ncbi:FRG domain-containing protein [Lactobacillaceae bacterium L1_55_11]|nr:FRG domain-containing protein [Lactobacillaceae bacterium L1_55_11]